MREYETLLVQRAALDSREVSSRELVERSLRRIDETWHLNAYLTLCGERALEEASHFDERSTGAKVGPLAGIPIAVKDLHETAGVRTTYGSLRFLDNVPSEDCAMVDRLRRAGAIVVAKTNTSAFGLLSETKNRLQGPCANPHDPSRTSGGSSGGSAVAVATGAVGMATGSDAAGSINVPAAFCGVIGVKPTVGLVPCVPASKALLPYISNGLLSTTVDDAAFTLGVAAGYDHRDPMSRPGAAINYLAAAREGPTRGTRVAWSSDLGRFSVDHEQVEAVASAAAFLAGEGCVVTSDEPKLEDPLGLYLDLYVTDSRQAGFDDPATWEELYPEALSELRDSPRLSGEQYAAALNRWWELRATMVEFFSRYQVLLVPTTASLAFAHDTMPSEIGGHPVDPVWTTWMPFTPIFNLTGQPCVSVPWGRSRGGLPLSVLAVGAPGQDATVLSVARLLAGC